MKKGGSDNAIGRSRGGLSTKIHAVVDQDGLPVRLLLSPGQASDMGAVPQLLAGLPTSATVVADRGYDSNAVLDLIASIGAQPSIPSCSRRILRRSVDPAIYRQRKLLPGKASDPGRTGSDNRLFVNGCLWVPRSGAHWRDFLITFSPRAPDLLNAIKSDPPASINQRRYDSAIRLA